MNNYEYLFEEYYKLNEAKDALIRKTNLTDEQKAEVIEFFRTHANLENQIEWNRVYNASNPLTYEDFEKVMVRDRTTASQAKKNSSQGLEGIKEGEDYEILARDANNEWVAYQPLNWTASRAIASHRVPPTVANNQDAKWCISYQKTSAYWAKHTSKTKEVFVIICGEGIEDGKVCLSISKTHSDADGTYFKFSSKGFNYNIWNFFDSTMEDNSELIDLLGDESILDEIIAKAYSNEKRAFEKLYQDPLVKDFTDHFCPNIEEFGESYSGEYNSINDFMIECYLNDYEWLLELPKRAYDFFDFETFGADTRAYKEDLAEDFEEELEAYEGLTNKEIGIIEYGELPHYYDVDEQDLLQYFDLNGYFEYLKAIGEVFNSKKSYFVKKNK